MLLERSGPARAALQHALTDSKEIGVLFWSSRIAEGLGEDAKALDISKQLSGRLEPDARAYAKLIQGELELKRGKAREAVALFIESQKIADTWLGRFDLGRGPAGMSLAQQGGRARHLEQELGLARVPHPRRRRTDPPSQPPRRRYRTEMSARAFALRLRRTEGTCVRWAEIG